MSNLSNEWGPEYAIPPGWVLQEYLEVRGFSQAKFARRCGRSPKLISEIIAGKAPLEAKTALQFEKVLGLDASAWINIESSYRLRLAREADAKNVAADIEWAKAFPVQELAKRECFPRPESDVDSIFKLLGFFRVASVDAWKTQYGNASVAYRHSPSFKSNEKVVATWLRLGEIEAEKQACASYNKGQFQKAVWRIRDLTCEPIDTALKQVEKLCNEAGVALALVKPLKRMALSGAAWWLSPKKAVVQLTARHKTTDRLWFSFFHEAAHVLLHNKKAVFVDENNENDTEQELEANKWASNLLIPETAWQQLTQVSPLNGVVVGEFAREQGIAPGIVVGRLQHEGVIPWRSPLNSLKVRVDRDF